MRNIDPLRLRHHLLVLVLAALGAGLGPPTRASEEDDVEAARALFERHLDAIRRHDLEGYLACYLPSEELVRVGDRGLRLGYDELAQVAAQRPWPDVFEAMDLRLVPIRPGVVFGSYRYRARFGAREESGVSERLFVETEDGWRIAVTGAFASPPGTPPPPRALVGATLIDGTGADPVANAVVVIRDGLVECAGSRGACPVPPAVDVTDLSGFWITPGLIDAHVHLASSAWLDSFPFLADLGGEFPYSETVANLRARPEPRFRALLCSGITAAFDMGSFSWIVEQREKARRSALAPHLAVTGPPLATWDLDVRVPSERMMVYLEDEAGARAGVDYLGALGTDAVKLWFVPADRDFAEMEPIVLAVGEQAAARGLPLVAHATGAREARIALRAGVRVLVHSVMDQGVDDAMVDEIVRRDVVYVPTLSVRDYVDQLRAAFASGTAPEVEDPNGCVDAVTLARIASTPRYRRRETAPGPLSGLSNEELRRNAAANLRRLHAAGATIAVGTDAGSPLVVHGPSIYVEMENMQAAGLAPMDVLVAATRGGAKALGQEGRIGTVEPGRVADLLVLAADPTQDVRHLRQLRFVVRGGEMRSITELRARPGGRGSADGASGTISPTRRP